MASCRLILLFLLAACVDPPIEHHSALDRVGPTARDDAYWLHEGDLLALDVCANDIDRDDGLDPGSLTVTRPPWDGSLSLLDGCWLHYAHDGTEGATDSFEYTVRDRSGTLSNPATVTIDLFPVNDPPIAGDDAFDVYESDTVVIDLIANDIDPEDELDPLSPVVTTHATYGFVGVAEDGTVTYAHFGDPLNLGVKSRVDAFAYTIADLDGVVSNEAVVTLSIGPDDDPPSALNDWGSVAYASSVVLDLAENDYDDGGLDLAGIEIAIEPEHGMVTVHTDGTVRYTHDGAEVNSDAFEYTIGDFSGQRSNRAFVYVTVF